MQRWFEVWPELLADEQRALEDLGFARDEEEFARGSVVFRGAVEWEGDDIEIVVVFPASYPTLRPEVYAPGEWLGRHQNPFRKNLCLLDRSTRAWHPGLSAAWLIEKQLPFLLGKLKEGGDALRDAEVPQGEPVSRFFRGAAGSAIFIDDPMLHLPAEQTRGTLRIAVGPNDQLTPVVRGCLSELRALGQGNREGDRLAVATDALRERFSKTALSGTWVRLPGFPVEGEGHPDELLQAVRATPDFPEPQWQRIGSQQIKIVGVVAPEEVEQGREEDTWLFALQLRQDKKPPAPYIVRGERLALEDLVARIPTLKGMQEKTIALAGLGALGAPLAMELAKALTGRLRVLDYDDVEAGNIVRWPFGISSAGHPKTAVLSSVLPNEWPLTKVEPFAHPLGAASPPGADEGEDEVEVVTKFLDNAHLMIDATAEVGIQQFLASQADQLSLPQVFVWMTEGGWGGVVARVVPGETGCWYCLQLALDDGSIELPPSDETGTIQPRGCGFLTYTGTSFDAMPLVAQAARVATATALRARSDGDPDVFVCDQKPRGDGAVRAPSWTEHPLAKRSECPYCGDDA